MICVIVQRPTKLLSFVIRLGSIGVLHILLIDSFLSRQENFQTDGSTVRVSMRTPLSETKETQRETSNAADLSPPDELMSPPLPPPPEEVQEIPADVEFPPPPPEFLLENDLHRERVPFDPKDR